MALATAIEMAKAEQEKSRDFFRTIKTQDLAALYLFHGEERFLVEKAVEEVLRRLFGTEGPDPLSFEVLRGGEADGKRISDAARTASMLGGERVVLVRDAERLSDADLQHLIAFGKKPPRRSYLVVVATKFDARKSAWAGLRAVAEEVKFQPLARYQMAEWIQRQCQRRSLRIDEGAADFLAEAIGTDMAMIDVALEKAAIAADGGTITYDVLRDSVADTRERSVFELTAALSTRTLSAVLSALRSLLEQGQSAIAINAMMVRHFRLLLKAKTGQAKRLSDGDLARFVGVSPFFMKEYGGAAKQYGFAELLALHAATYEADRLLKSSRLPDVSIIEAVLLQACLPSPKR